MTALAARLNSINRSYDSFVAAVMTYINNKPSRQAVVEEFLNSHPDASTSEILSFISDQADFYEDTVWTDIEAG